MASHCDWCGGTTESGTAISVSHEDRQGVESNPHSEITASLVCHECTDRLAGKMYELRRTLGLNPEGTEEELARQMISVIDVVDSEPPERDWEETF